MTLVTEDTVLPEVLNQLHKTVFIDQLPPTLERDAQRSYIKAVPLWPCTEHIKRELFKLLSSVPEAVGMHTQRGAGRDNGNVTYEALSAMMEDILLETNFFANLLRHLLAELLRVTNEFFVVLAMHHNTKGI